MRASPLEKEPSRRNHSWQRQRLLELLRSTDSHPTAASLHVALRVDFPRLSLGTVYRNLDVLVSEGEIEAVPSGGGVVRYDGNPVPHHHFVCEHCGEIEDLELPLPRGLLTRLQRRHGLTPRRVRIDFYGLCRACSDSKPT
jgi:Fe2+ or Zn2+ uptake regulation protein